MQAKPNKKEATKKKTSPHRGGLTLESLAVSRGYL
jgi:hypothetical protein